MGLPTVPTAAHSAFAARAHPRERDASAAGLSEGDWEARLSRAAQRAVRVRFGRSRTRVVQAAYDATGGVLAVRLHAMFARAPDDVQVALGHWLRSGRRARSACLTLDRWIAEAQREWPAAPARPQTLKPAGRVHDLTRLAQELSHAEFPGRFASPPGLPGITWGRQQKSRSRRSLRLGSFDWSTRVVRLHPVLDSPRVPEFFVRYVLFHELLHADLDEVEARAPGARRVLHGPEFKRRERLYGDHARALAWERAHIDALIRAARRGVPLPQRASAPGRAPADAPRSAAGRALDFVQRLLF